MPNLTPDRARRGHSFRAGLLAGLAFSMVLAACGPAASSPPSAAPTAKPTPTPVAATVATPEDAATLVIATNPMFAGTTQLDPEIIGASRWWTAEPLPGGGYRIQITIGWGDCQAGCIDRHIWTFEVDPDGTVKPIGEEGSEIPVDLPA